MNVPLTEERWYLGDYGIKIYPPPLLFTSPAERDILVSPIYPLCDEVQPDV